MLGMCGISFLAIFIQFHIIASLVHKINPFFKKFLYFYDFFKKPCDALPFSFYSIAITEAPDSCQVLNFSQRNRLW